MQMEKGRSPRTQGEKKLTEKGGLRGNQSSQSIKKDAYIPRGGHGEKAGGERLKDAIEQAREDPFSKCGRKSGGAQGKNKGVNQVAPGKSSRKSSEEIRRIIEARCE